MSTITWKTKRRVFEAMLLPWKKWGRPDQAESKTERQLRRRRNYLTMHVARERYIFNISLSELDPKAITWYNRLRSSKLTRVGKLDIPHPVVVYLNYHRHDGHVKERQASDVRDGCRRTHHCRHVRLRQGQRAHPKYVNVPICSAPSSFSAGTKANIETNHTALIPAL